MSAYLLETERLGLRKWKSKDLVPFSAMNKDTEVMQWFPKLLTDAETHEMMKRIHIHFENHGFGLFAVENKLTKKFLGYTGFIIPKFEAFFTPCVEIAWRFKKEFWKQGFATEAAKACLTFGFEELKFKKVLSMTSILNLKSEAVMKRIGMKFMSEFDHPLIEKDNRLCRHMLYKLENLES